MALNGRKPPLVITEAEAQALLPHVHHACRALQAIAAMHAAARLPSQRKEARLASRRLAAFAERLNALASVPADE